MPKPNVHAAMVAAVNEQVVELDDDSAALLVCAVRASLEADPPRIAPATVTQRTAALMQQMRRAPSTLLRDQESQLLAAIVATTRSWLTARAMADVAEAAEHAN